MAASTFGLGNKRSVNVHEKDKNNSGSIISQVKLRPVSEIEPRYRQVFPYVHLNHVQSVCFDTIMLANNPLLVCAPTGSGKTGVLELAIVRLLKDLADNKESLQKVKIVYLAPTKALCTERKNDWIKKFQPYGLSCLEVTADSYGPDENFSNIQKSHLLLATPEKWDSITRGWNDHAQFAASIRLVLIDEVHLINDGPRGATLEVVISRMKTMRSLIWPNNQDKMRLLGISATISNTEDMAQWFSTPTSPCKVIEVDPMNRPVKLKTVVLGYSGDRDLNEFKFDNMLNRKLANVINEYSECKPTLIFCSTRKSAVGAATCLAREGKLDIFFNVGKRRQYLEISHKFKDSKLQETTRFGIAFHHAGLEINDRRLVEQGFLEGKIMILASTSTLSTGVNLPAHLVIIKTTTYIKEGRHVQYGESSLVQMMGRAGRPQFDTHATAVIMTRTETRTKIEKLLRGSLVVDSHLHTNMDEHVNSEIVLQTISNDEVAKKWLASTYLYVRICKNPEKYGLPPGCNLSDIETELDNRLKLTIQKLLAAKLVERDRNFQLLPTESGRAMAKFYVSLDTMVRINQLTGHESLENILEMICSAQEIVSDILLRTEQSGALEKIRQGKGENELRFKLNNLDERSAKAAMLIQATFGGITINDNCLTLEALRIMKSAQRVVSCLRCVALMSETLGFRATLNIFLMAKSFAARLWENSIFVARQLEGIGQAYGKILAENGMITFDALKKADPRILESFTGKRPPFGSIVQQTCFGLPKYNLRVRSMEIPNSSDIIEFMVDVVMENGQDLRSLRTVPSHHVVTLLVGNKADNRVILKQKISDTKLLGRPDFTVTVGKTVPKILLPYYSNDLEVHLISDLFVGLDVHITQKFTETS